MAAPREAIVGLCNQRLPETKNVSEYIHWNEVGFDNLAKDYGQGMGTTCGFLPHYLLWRFGCRDNSLVNRSSPPEGLTNLIGANISILQTQGKKVVPSWVKMDGPGATQAAAGKGGPKPGDFVIIRGGFWVNKTTKVRDLDSAHVFVLLDVVKADGKTVQWRVAQSGVSNNAGQQGAQITTLTGELREGEMDEAGKMVKGPHLVFVANIIGEEPNFPRRVIGYSDLDRIGFGSFVSPSFIKLFEDRWRTPATNELAKVNQWFGWYEMDSPGGFIKMNKPFLLLHRGHEAYRLEKDLGPYTCTARGLWTLTGKTVDITWDDSTPDQSWLMATTYVPKMKTGGAPKTGNTGALTRVAQLDGKKAPDAILPQWYVQ